MSYIEMVLRNKINELEAERNDLKIKHGLVIEAHKVTVSDLMKVEAERNALQARVDELHGSMLLDGRFTSASVEAATIEQCMKTANGVKHDTADGSKDFADGFHAGRYAAASAVKALKPLSKS